LRRKVVYTEKCCAARKEAKRTLSEKKTTRPVAQCAILLIAICASMSAAESRLHPTCITNKVVIIDKPSGSSSSDAKENFNFWIDEASKSVSFADGGALSVQWFDDRWISATAGSNFL
jgi:hypothetical protein